MPGSSQGGRGHARAGTFFAVDTSWWLALAAVGVLVRAPPRSVSALADDESAEKPAVAPMVARPPTFAAVVTKVR